MKLEIDIAKDYYKIICKRVKERQPYHAPYEHEIIANGKLIRKGQWIEHFDESGKWYECDQCHTDWGGAVNFCPNCGAIMKSEDNHE